MIATKYQQENSLFLRISPAKEQSVYGIDMKIPISRMKQTSESFLQWRDKEFSGAFGLNFISEKDLKKFLKLCTVSKEVKEASNQLHSSNSSIDSLKASKNSSSSWSLDSSGGRESPNKKSLSEQLSSNITQQQPVIRKPLVPPKPTLKQSLSGSSDKYNKTVDVPAGYDPLEYEYLMKSKNDDDDNDEELKLSVGISKSLNDTLNINSDLSNSKNFDSRSTVSANIQESRPPSVINLTRQIMTTRKAAWLLVKNVLIHSKKGKVELSSNRKWRKYWVKLKGVELVFYHANERTVTSDDLDEASYRLDIDCCLAQPVPEYARLENVFSLSTKHGNAYYFQATSQAEVENWIHCIHSSAAMAFARKKGVDNMPVMLKKEIRFLRDELHSDEKLRKMAQLQLKVERELYIRQNINQQIISWDHSIEVRHANIFRLRCYLSAIDSTIIPNPQDLLTHVSRSTKQALAKLGFFSVASFHSYVNARNAILPPPEEKPKSRLKVKSTSIKTKLMNHLKANDDSVVSSRKQRFSPHIKRRHASLESLCTASNSSSRSSNNKYEFQGHHGDQLFIQLPDNKTISIPYEENLKIIDLKERICLKESLDSIDFFILLMKQDNNQNGLLNYDIPKEKSMLEQFSFSSIKLCPKLIYDATLTETANYENDCYGMKIDETKDGRILITTIEDGSPARKQGLMVDDEIIQINGQDLREIRHVYYDVKEVLFTSTTIRLKLRSNRIDDPKKTILATESIISFLVCPPPPKTMQPEMTDDMLNSLIVPAPTDFDVASTASTPRSFNGFPCNREINTQDIDYFLMQTEAVNMMTREMNAIVSTPPVPVKMKPCVKLKKAIMEMLETEKTYIKNIKVLLERYLMPLKEEDFLPIDEAELIVGNVREIHDFQLTFYERLKDIIRSEKNFETFNEVTQLQNIIYLIGETFLEYIEKFKLYSTFCSCHSRAVKLLELNTNEALKAFMAARNPKQHHTGSLESYLITPIQRILRYPLLMKTMLKYMVPGSDEYNCLSDALTSIETVANYINEMQRISETYTPIFEEMCKDCLELEKGDVSNVENLLHYGKVLLIPPFETSSLNHRSISSSIESFQQNGDSLNIFIFKKAIILLSNIPKSDKKKCLSQSPSMSSKSSNSDTGLQVLLPISQILLRDYAWSDNDSNQVWEIVDTTDGKEEIYTFLNRTGEEKKVFVNAIKQSKRINKLSNSNPLLGVKHEGILKNGNLSSKNRSPRTLQKSDKSVNIKRPDSASASTTTIKSSEKLRGRYS